MNKCKCFEYRYGTELRLLQRRVALVPLVHAPSVVNCYMSRASHSVMSGRGSFGSMIWMRLYRFLDCLQSAMAVSPSLFFMDASAPASMSFATHTASPTVTAYMSAVQPSLSTALRSTCFSMSCA